MYSRLYGTLNPIPTGLGHVTLIYGLIPPMACRNRVNDIKCSDRRGGLIKQVGLAEFFISCRVNCFSSIT